MEKRTLNLIFALITGSGSIPKNMNNSKLNLWACQPAVKFFADIFIREILGNTNEINPNNFGGFNPIASSQERVKKSVVLSDINTKLNHKEKSEIEWKNLVKILFPEEIKKGDLHVHETVI